MTQRNGNVLTVCWTASALAMLISLAFLVAGPACISNTGGASHTDQTVGAVLFRTNYVTAGGESQSCDDCHGANGSGGPDVDIRGSSSSHLQSHAQGTGTHPDGVKYPDLTDDDFVAIAEFLGGEGAGNDDHDDGADDLVGDAQRGMELFRSPQPTAGGIDLSCSSCHRQDGAGAGGPSLLDQAAGHLMEHAQESGEHPEGIKFPELTAQDFADMAAFLSTETDGHQLSPILVH